jgi:hypothetical protein
VPDRASLVEDLVYLRKGEGLTPIRLIDTMTAYRIAGGPTSLPEVARDRISSCLRGMLDTKGGRALWAAFGLDAEIGPDPVGSVAGRGLLHESRAAHAQAVGRSPDTVRDWEDGAIDELALRLLSGWHASAATPADSVMPHGGFLIPSLAVAMVIRDRVFFESHQTRTLLSLVEGATHFVYGTYTPSTLTRVTGGTAASEDHQDGTLHRIAFDRPIPRGEQHTFSFRETEPSNGSDLPGPPDQDFAGQTFDSPTLRYRNEVVFLGDRPAVVWSYDKLSRIERPGHPTSANTIELGHGRTVVTEFHDLYGGLASGVAWRW